MATPNPASDVHSAAVEAHDGLEKLATALAAAGADKPTLQVVQKMSNITKQLVHAVGKPSEGQGQPQGPPQGGPPEQAQPRSTADATNQMMAGMKGGTS